MAKEETEQVSVGLGQGDGENATFLLVDRTKSSKEGTKDNLEGGDENMLIGEACIATCSFCKYFCTCFAYLTCGPCCCCWCCGQFFQWKSLTHRLGKLKRPLVQFADSLVSLAISPVDREEERFFPIKAALTSMWVPCVVGDKEKNRRVFLISGIISLVVKALAITLSLILAYTGYPRSLQSRPMLLFCFDPTLLDNLGTSNTSRCSIYDCFSIYENKTHEDYLIQKFRMCEDSSTELVITAAMAAILLFCCVISCLSILWLHRRSDYSVLHHDSLSSCLCCPFPPCEPCCPGTCYPIVHRSLLLHYINESKSEELELVLKDCKPEDVLRTNKTGDTLLDAAARVAGWTSVMKLLERGAQLTEDSPINFFHDSHGLNADGISSIASLVRDSQLGLLDHLLTLRKKGRRRLQHMVVGHSDLSCSLYNKDKEPNSEAVRLLVKHGMSIPADNFRTGEAEKIVEKWNSQAAGEPTIAITDLHRDSWSHRALYEENGPITEIQFFFDDVDGRQDRMDRDMPYIHCLKVRYGDEWSNKVALSVMYPFSSKLGASSGDLRLSHGEAITSVTTWQEPDVDVLGFEFRTSIGRKKRFFNNVPDIKDAKSEMMWGGSRTLAYLSCFDKYHITPHSASHGTRIVTEWFVFHWM